MDWNKAYGLLHIADKARQWPHLRWLHDEAMKELKRMHDEPLEPPTVETVRRIEKDVAEKDVA